MIRKFRLFIGLISLMFLAGQTWGQPELTVTEGEFNFGYVPHDARIVHNFWLHSTGTDTLKIEKVITGCGCTKAPLEKDIIAPGDSARLEIIFNTNKYKNRVVKSPRITSNAEQPESQVTIITDVIDAPYSTPSIAIEPFMLDMSKTGKNDPVELTFTIRNLTQNNIEQSMISYPEELFEVQLPKIIKAGEIVRGTVKLKANGSVSDFEKSFTIELNDDNKSRFTIPVTRGFHKKSASLQ